MPRVTVTLEGGEELVARLKSLGGRVDQALEVATTAGAEVVRLAASRMAPGPHVEKEVVERSAQRVVVAVGPDKTHWYYRFSEVGTGPHSERAPVMVFEGADGTVFTRMVEHPGMAAKPFLRPAFDGEQQAAVDEMGRRIRQVVESGG